MIDAALQARFEAGNEVGDLAMGLFGPYEEVTCADSTGRLDLKEMLLKTQDCLSRGVENICEAAFSWDGNYCAVDILHKQDGGYAIYEVKSSTNSSLAPSDSDELEHYAWDIAYQTMGGSFSIKKVLPALFPNDSQLNYDNLPGAVHNGGDAMTIYPKIKDMSPDEQQAARQALLEYCHLDTLAMVRIWQKLEEISV